MDVSFEDRRYDTCSPLSLSRSRTALTTFVPSHANAPFHAGYRLILIMFDRSLYTASSVGSGAMLMVFCTTPLQGRRTGTALIMTAMALFALQPGVEGIVFQGIKEMAAAFGRDGGAQADGAVDWRELIKQSCGVCMASVGILVITRIVSPTT